MQTSTYFGYFQSPVGPILTALQFLIKVSASRRKTERKLAKINPNQSVNVQGKNFAYLTEPVSCQVNSDLLLMKMVLMSVFQLNVQQMRTVSSHLLIQFAKRQ